MAPTGFSSNGNWAQAGVASSPQALKTNTDKRGLPPFIAKQCGKCVNRYRCKFQWATKDSYKEFLKHVDIVNFREAMSEKGQDYEVAFVEGSITREEEVIEVKKIRSQAKVLIAIGACAHLGGVNSLKMLHPKETWVKSVYGRDDVFKDTIDTKRISDVVEVDHTIPGCPIDKGEFLRVLSSLLLGAKPVLPDHPVCVECKKNENI